MDHVAAHHCSDRMDGGDALFAPPVRLSYRDGARFGFQRALQSDGTPAAQSHYESLHDRDVDFGTVARFANGRLSRYLDANQVCFGDLYERPAWLFRSMLAQLRK